MAALQEIRKQIKAKPDGATIKVAYKGVLDTVILRVVENAGQLKKADVIIESSLGFPILKKTDLTDVEYCAPRKQTMPIDSDMRSSAQYDRFNLNEDLLISVFGADGVVVEAILRD